MRPRSVRALLCCLLLIGLGPASAAEPLRLRVLSYNIHHGAGVDGKLDLSRIAGVITAAAADLVALQEVDRLAARTDGVDQPAELARLTRLHVAFGRNIALPGVKAEAGAAAVPGEYGNALLSRFPITGHENHPLPNPDQGEKRGVLQVDVSLPNERGSIQVLATHLAALRTDRERQASAQAINALPIARSDSPALLIGDLNDTRGSATLALLAQAWQLAGDRELPTSPAPLPRRQIDFVLVRPAKRWRVIEVRVLDEPVASDHRPLLAICELD